MDTRARPRAHAMRPRACLPVPADRRRIRLSLLARSIERTHTDHAPAGQSIWPAPPFICSKSPAGARRCAVPVRRLCCYEIKANANARASGGHRSPPSRLGIVRPDRDGATEDGASATNDAWSGMEAAVDSVVRFALGLHAPAVTTNEPHCYICAIAQNCYLTFYSLHLLLNSQH